MYNLDLVPSNLKTATDICDNGEINGIFSQAHNLCERVVANNKYVLHIDATSENDPNIGITLSSNSCEVYKLSNQQLAILTTLPEHTEKIIECKFSKQDHNLIYTGSSDGICLWDIRTPKKFVVKYLDTSTENNKNKTLSCFDISANERLLTAGTELFEGDPFLLFWDIRNHELLGGYWESHTDDITQVKFHPEYKDRLLSGSTDGLINVYDLSQSCEEDALISTLNTLSSVDHLLWFDENRKSNFSCITHTSDLQLWNIDGAEPYKQFTRSDISKELRMTCEDFTYLANIHSAADHLLLLAGSSFEDSDCLRGMHIKNGKIQPAYNFKCNKQRVRSSWFNPDINILITGGENGILDVWNLK